MDPHTSSAYSAYYEQEARRGAPAAGGLGDFAAGVFFPQSPRFVQALHHGAPDASEGRFDAEESGARLTRAALEGTMRLGSTVGTALLEGGGKILERANIIGEGPKPLRALCFLGGIALIGVSALQIVNIVSAVGNPASYILQFFLMMFGVAICVVEAKDLEHLERLKPFFANWFRFLTVPLGKGLFYILIGTISLSLWTSNFLLLFVGGYMILMGIMCVMVHFGLRQQLQRRGIDVSESEESTDRVRIGEQLGANQIQQTLFNPASR
ncbi:hypothetical protein BESB_050340 [Besnoitia besnoiti]|uniref:COPI associated protein n=1 Tax=Besnoitia besnoiti TaxID=94643 RepID=A0A2A9MMQ4_BESBE|nr:hypothetical protein BESB_050340 [Besnoitia besnoiti]PFH36842.1 hypothetical protein BESB_050340 [Besnoitia besnoiti]